MKERLPGWRHTLFLLLILIIHSFSFARVPEIKVRIGKKLSKVIIRGTDIKRQFFTSRQDNTRHFLGYNTIVFNCNKQTKKRPKNSSKLLAGLNSPTGMLVWDESHYHGKLEVMTSGRDKHACDLINKLPMDDYVNSVLSKEMNSSWPIEALKAQAVAARSYAYYKMKKRDELKRFGKATLFDIESSEFHQVSGSFFDSTPTTKKATILTKGEILANKSGGLVPIFFHSKCGGKTLRPDQVWINKIDGYKSVDCPFCHNHGRKSWKHQMSQKNFRKLVGPELLSGRRPLSKEILFVPDSPLNSILRFYHNGEMKTVKKSNLRKKLGRKKLPSNLFKAKKIGKKIEISGEGYGHGVGMCQMGALAMAKKGWNYREILSYYYGDFKIKKVY